MPHAGNTHSKEPNSAGLLTASRSAPLKRMMTVEEVAAYLSVPKQRIYVLTHTRAIPFVRIGRTVRFDLPAIDAWLDARRVEPDIFPKKEA